MRLQPEGTPDPRVHGLAHADRRAMARVDQWVAFSGWLSRVRVIICSISVSATWRGAPGPGQVDETVEAVRQETGAPCRDAHAADADARAMPLLVEPGSAQASTMRARWARAWPTLRRRTRPCSRVRSSPVRSRCAGLDQGPS